jgi:geranylgeranyl diphosphate synthase type I
MDISKETNALENFREVMLPAIEEVLQAEVDKAGGSGTVELREMLRYHLGWEGEGSGRKAQGKRIRPLLVLLAAEAAGGKWEDVLPSAAAVELLHNFSLIHDDIQDNSSMRRGRPTLWTKWGIPQSINAGDSLFALAHDSLKGLKKHSTDVYANSIEVLPLTSLKLTQGQYMDLAFEEKEAVSIQEYWEMVGGKTAVLLATCAELGAIGAQASKERSAHFRLFGEKLGLAFQAHDDILGIWGSENQTGKSNHSDLLSRKKSLPVLFGLAKGGKFAEIWPNWKPEESSVGELASALENDGARGQATDMVGALTQEALTALDLAKPETAAGEALKMLGFELVQRNY